MLYATLYNYTPIRLSVRLSHAGSLVYCAGRRTGIHISAAVPTSARV